MRIASFVRAMLNIISTHTECYSSARRLAVHIISDTTDDHIFFFRRIPSQIENGSRLRILNL